jgi:hypothetical protein
MIQLQVYILYRLFDLGLSTDTGAVFVAVRSYLRQVTILTAYGMALTVQGGVCVAVTLGRNDLLCHENCVAYRAVFSFCETGCDTGRSNSIVGNFRMSLGHYGFDLGCLTGSTGVGLATDSGTGCFLDNHSGIPDVAYDILVPTYIAHTLMLSSTCGGKGEDMVFMIYMSAFFTGTRVLSG